jgi:N-formylglutamate amidohydrolase
MYIYMYIYTHMILHDMHIYIYACTYMNDTQILKHRCLSTYRRAIRSTMESFAEMKRKRLG